MVSITIVIGGAIASMRSGYGPAKMFLFAWGGMLIGILAKVLSLLGKVPDVVITQYGVHAGFALEAALISVAIITRFVDEKN